MLTAPAIAAPWCARVAKFNADGSMSQEWTYYSYGPGGYWGRDQRNTMPLSEMLAALRQLRRATDRMPHLDWGADRDEVLQGRHHRHPRWHLEIELLHREGETNEERLLRQIFHPGTHGCAWDFPDEVGCFTCTTPTDTLAFIDWLIERKAPPSAQGVTA